jgi:hypothetical protein
MTWFRLAALVVAAVACLASGSSSSSRREEKPPPGQAGSWWCHNEQGPNGKIVSQCRPAQDACESERGAAQGDGLATSSCAQVPEVACFQLGGDPAPASEWCAATSDDCEFWKRIDESKNGLAGQRCDWRR